VNQVAYVWVDDVRRTLKPTSDFHKAIWWALKKAGIVIALPQPDVHLDPPSRGKRESRGAERERNSRLTPTG
jgi:small-conductance mechanosensitive channel